MAYISKKKIGSCVSQGPAMFDLLPNELLLKIVKMAAAFMDCRHCGVPTKFNHNFITRVLTKVSTRFKIISSDKTLWSNICLEDDSHGVLKDVVENYIGSFTQVFWIRLNFILNNEDKFAKVLRAISSRCNKLQSLILTFPEEGTHDQFKWSSFCRTALHDNVRDEARMGWWDTYRDYKLHSGWQEFDRKWCVGRKHWRHWRQGALQRKMLYLKAAEWSAVDEDGHLRSFDILFARGSEQKNYDSGSTNDRRAELERKKEKLRQIGAEKERRKKEREAEESRELHFKLHS